MGSIPISISRYRNSTPTTTTTITRLLTAKHVTKWRLDMPPGHSQRLHN
ncbi:unnamed protein product [Schistocephalus solidus]|uniref:Uncharacterized protein n=1 Tax=Schistocephalus solidus TaxID=70667 RepID=A0A3P7DS99_SCHSO|nr:unnamed protein product [Schistocephalus solidus]